MWTPKSPEPEYFCGCEGCPLCFDWAEPITDWRLETAEEAQPEVEVISGVEKMGLDLLGRLPTPDEKASLKTAAEAIHKANVARMDPNGPDDFKDHHAHQRIEMTVAAVIKTKLRERVAPKLPRPDLNTVTVDDMDPERVKELCDMTAPVDKELINREQDQRKARKQLELMKEQQREYERLLSRYT